MADVGGATYKSELLMELLVNPGRVHSFGCGGPGIERAHQGILPGFADIHSLSHD